MARGSAGEKQRAECGCGRHDAFAAAGREDKERRRAYPLEVGDDLVGGDGVVAVDEDREDAVLGHGGRAVHVLRLREGQARHAQVDRGLNAGGLE